MSDTEKENAKTEEELHTNPMLAMRVEKDSELKEYLSKITDEALYSYNVYQIEGEGRNLFSKIEGDENTIMGLPVDKIKQYIEGL